MQIIEKLVVSLENQTTTHVIYRIVDAKLVPAATVGKDSGSGDFSHFIQDGKCYGGGK